MAITINTNITSLSAQRHLSAAQSDLSRSMERLASGLRINRAKDDAAGMSISLGLTKQVSGLLQSNRNANDGVSVIQTTEGALNEITNNLQRMRDLAVQASSGSYSDANRSALQIEFSSLRAEIDRVSNNSEFNGFKLADGSQSSMSIQVGGNNNADNRITIKMINTKSSALGISAATIASAGGAQNALDSLDTAISSVSSARAVLGTSEGRLATAMQSNLYTIENLTGANSRIKDVDFAEEVSNMARENVLVQAGTAMLAQANTIPNTAMQLLRG